MNKSIAIIAGEPNSISSEIIFKSWKLRKQYIHKPMFVIGNIRLLNLQKIKKKTNLEELKNQLVNAEKTKILNMYSMSHFDNLRRSTSINFFNE